MQTVNFPYSFKDFSLLRTALTVPAANRPQANNQRLEFLGDAVLQLLTSDILYTRYPDAAEGVLTDMRQHLVSGRALMERRARLGRAFTEGLAQFNRGYTWEPKAEVDAIEALLGAAWLDGGLDAARSFFDLLYSEEDFAGVAHCTGVSDNPKGELQQYAQKRGLPDPVYRELDRSGLSHDPIVHCSVTLEGRSAEGYGKSRKAAEREAAQNLYQTLSASAP